MTAWAHSTREPIRAVIMAKEAAHPGGGHPTSTGMSPYACVMEFNELIKRRRMVHAFTAEPLAPGTADRLREVLAVDGDVC
jgi:hypothetical protein